MPWYAPIVAMSCLVVASHATHSAAGGHVREGVPLPLEVALTNQNLCSRTPIDLSPDGRYLAYGIQDTERAAVSRGDFTGSIDSGAPKQVVGCDVWVADTLTGKAQSVGGGRSNNWAPAWSPDGRSLAFFSDEGGKARVWIWERATQRAREIPSAVIRTTKGEETPRWSPDGRTLLVKALPKSAGPVTEHAAAHAATTGDSSLDKLAAVTVYRSKAIDDRAGASSPSRKPMLIMDAVSDAHRADLALIDVADGTSRLLVSDIRPDWYSFSPDGSAVAFTDRKGQIGSGYHNVLDLRVIALSDLRTRLQVSDIVNAAYTFNASWAPNGAALSYKISSPTRDLSAYVVNVPKTSAVVPSSELRPFRISGGTIEAPVWSPQSTRVFVALGDSLWSLAASDGTARHVAAIANHTILSIVSPRGSGRPSFSDDGSALTVVTRNELTFEHGFYRVDPRNGAASMLREEDADYGSDIRLYTDVSDDGTKLVYAAQKIDEPLNFWIAGAKFGKVQRVTNFGSQYDGYMLGKSRLLSWLSADGVPLHGALLLPSDYRSGRRYPLIVQAYGGAKLSWHLNTFGLRNGLDNMHLLATRGYAVLLADSIETRAAPMRDWAGSILPGVNKAIELGIADGERLGVMGQSNGGYTTLALIVQTQRFKAAVMLAGFGNLFGLYGSMGADGSAEAIDIIESGTSNMAGTPWQIREKYIENSPALYLDNVATPLLIHHGARDSRVSPFLADEIFVGLRHLGREVTYLKYANEGHGFAARENQFEYWRQTLDWFDRHLKH